MMCIHQKTKIVILVNYGNEYEMLLKFSPTLFECMSVSPIVKHKANIIMNPNIHRSQGVRWGGFLFLLVSNERDLILTSRHNSLPIIGIGMLSFLFLGGIFMDIKCLPNALGNISNYYTTKELIINIDRLLKFSLKKDVYL
jgi:hypothetical protein